MNIRALNEPETSSSSSGESSEDDGRQQSLSKEALQEQCFDKYKKALIAMQNLKNDEAKDLLEDLNSQLDEFGDNDNATLAQLRFSVLKNLGHLKSEDVDEFLQALAIDGSDISLWIKTGDRTMKLQNFAFARICYERALELNPDNWVAIDRLMELYYVLHLPFELYDICLKALSLNRRHTKALSLLERARHIQPSLCKRTTPKSENCSHDDSLSSDIVRPLENIKAKRRHQLQNELQRFKRARLSIMLDTTRTQSLASFGNYVIKIYERFSKQCITRNTVIDITLSSTMPFGQQFSNGSVGSQSINQNSNEPSSQDVEMATEGEGTSISDNDKSDPNRNEPTTSNDDNDQTKSNSRNKTTSQSISKTSSLSFAAMLFPMDSGDKRRSSRNRSNQDDTFSFKMKFDELNELLPECLRIGAIEQALQQRREEQQRDHDEKEREKREESVLVETNLEPVREDLIIKDIIEAISERLYSPNSNTRQDIKLCDLFFLYLSKLAGKKQNTLPEVYTKIYRVYRKLSPLPTDAFVEIGPNGISLDELWFILAVNEINYNSQECMFLLRLLEQLQMYLDAAQHKEFLVRLFMILGLNLDHGYLELALNNIEEDTKVYASNRKIITRAHLKTLIDRTTEKMMHENENPNDSLELINQLAPKSENEMSDREINSLCSAIKSAKVWQRGLDILNQRNDLSLDVIIEAFSVCLRNGAKMDAILASKLCKEAVSGSRPAVWTCLYYGWLSVLEESELHSNDMIEQFDKFFELAHQTLGKKCTCTSDKGELLMLYVKHLLMDERDSFEERELLGCLSCLFNYPAKKPSAVVSHKSQRVPMQWDYAEIIYHYFEPEHLPTYMCLLRKRGITSELEPIFKEMSAVVPDRFNPAKVAAADVIKDHIEKGSPLDTVEIEKNDITKDIFYYLADFYFKNKFFDKAKTFYYYDLAINPKRFDSWAAYGLILANAVDKALSEGTVTLHDFTEGEFHNLSNKAIRCFERATQLKPNEAKATLWIEFGNLTYNLLSLASRLFCYEDFAMAMESGEPFVCPYLEQRHIYLHKLTKNCFKSAITLCQSEEVWLQYYMLGKTYEKFEPLTALDYYSQADAHLFLEGATYPKKIMYHNPPELAFESMEVHYRIHSCALKYLLTTSTISQETMNLLKRILLNAQRSPFVTMEGVQYPKSNIYPTIERDVGVLVEDLADSVCEEAEFDELIFMCLHGMKRCLMRSDKNFKALYRLAYYYRKIRDNRLAKEILWCTSIRTDRRIANLRARKPNVPEFRVAPPDLKDFEPLFVDRKPNNLFCNVWRIPIEEIDRPGCFEHWMFKCCRMVIRIATDIRDANALYILACQLYYKPQTSKKYLQDKPRQLLSLCAAKCMVKVLMELVEKAETVEQRQAIAFEGARYAENMVRASAFTKLMQPVFNQLNPLAGDYLPPR